MHVDKSKRKGNMKASIRSTAFGMRRKAELNKSKIGILIFACVIALFEAALVGIFVAPLLGQVGQSGFLGQLLGRLIIIGATGFALTFLLDWAFDLVRRK